MAEFELDEKAVQDTEQKLFDTGVIVNTEAGKARDSVTGSVGTLQGMAINAASNKQTGEFADISQRLFNEINHIGDALGLSRNEIMAQDQMDEQEFMNISPEGGYTRI